MKIKITFKLLSFASIFGLCLSCSNTNISSNGISDKDSSVTSDSFVNRLTELGFYKYADVSDIEKLKKNLKENFDPNNELVSIWDDESGLPKDYRYYFCDGETLFELGGFDLYLNEFRATYDKIGLKMEISKCLETGDSKTGIDYRVTINGRDYVIFEKFKGMGWGEAAVRLATILNDQLQIQNKDERVYLVSGGNDGRIIFLTNEQFGFIDSVYKNDNWKPLPVERWCEVMKINMQELK
jgi:hypothetical protein